MHHQLDLLARQRLDVDGRKTRAILRRRGEGQKAGGENAAEAQSLAEPLPNILATDGR
jgi:hypothetical protein